MPRPGSSSCAVAVSRVSSHAPTPIARRCPPPGETYRSPSPRSCFCAARVRGGGEVSYEHDEARAIAAATGDTSVILVRAVDPATLRAVADAGERLPQKTTYFYPKVPAGLIIRTLDDDQVAALRVRWEREKRKKPPEPPASTPLPRSTTDASSAHRG